MNTQTGQQGFEEREVEELFRQFWSCITHMDSTLSDDMTEGEVESIRDDIETLIELSDRVHCKIATEEQIVPDTPFDVEQAIERQAAASGLPKDAFRERFFGILEDNEEIRVQEAWARTLDSLERRRDELEAKRSSTSVSDWQ